MALENLMKQIKLQLKMRFNIIIKHKDNKKFDFLKYFQNLTSRLSENISISFAQLCYSTMSDKNFEKLSKKTKIIVKKLEEYEKMLSKSMTKFLVQFYSQPIDEKMAETISMDILTSPL
jgi:hypothetical protein